MATKTIKIALPFDSSIDGSHFKDPHANQVVLTFAMNCMKELLDTSNLSKMTAAYNENQAILNCMEALRASETQKSQLLLDRITDLEEQNKKLHEKTQDARILTIQDLGKIAEEEVSNSICEVIPCESLNISSNSHHTPTTHGDRHIIAARGSNFDGLCMFVEVKRKTCIRAEDITRFHAQLAQDINGRVNAALFVSTASQTIPNSTFPVSIDVLCPSNGPQIPIAFVASDSKKVIQTTALAIAHLQKKCQDQHSGDGNPSDAFRQFTQTIQFYLPKIILFLEKQEENSRRKIDSLFSVIHEIQNEREDLREVNQMIHELFEALPFLKCSVPDETLLLFARVMSRKRYRNSEEVRLGDFTSREKTLIEKNGGITNIRRKFDSKQRGDKLV